MAVYYHFEFEIDGDPFGLEAIWWDMNQDSCLTLYALNDGWDFDEIDEECWCDGTDALEPIYEKTDPELDLYDFVNDGYNCEIDEEGAIRLLDYMDQRFDGEIVCRNKLFDSRNSI